MKRKLFGTDGIRGKANIYPMTGDIAFLLGRAVTAYFQNDTSTKKPTIIIGKDTRLSCYMLEQAFSSGVCAQGGFAILTGPLPTPGVAFVTKSMRAEAGVMISASHNPFEDNGIKIFDQDGNKLADDVELKLEQMILDPQLIPQMLGNALGKAKRLDEVVGRYIVKVKSAFDEKLSLDNIRLIVDGANGAAYKVAPWTFEELGAEVISIGNAPNGTNINKNVGALYPEKCARAVKEYRADLGICLDGDADRIVVCDEKGNVVEGDRLLGVLAKFLKDTNQMADANEVVGTVMTNLGLEVFIKSLGLNFYRAKVGDRYILERMNQTGSVFGGEPSGHIIFKKFSTTGDGILAALKVIECIKYYNMPLSKLVEQVKLFPQVLINVAVSEKKDLDSLSELNEKIKKWQEKLGDKGRTLIRYSGTENLCRVMVEGEDNSLVKKCANDLADTIKKELG
ncbi:MAG: phosphoglucosamine mutase [Bacteriovoracaceae bacterium]|jgi:phosphoglucosamine mutase|nr:phosphoglucosamine mutase [Bacteriovoracaceae bacterium]